MREQMERLVVLPFSIGCVSQASIAVEGGNSEPKKPKPEIKPPVARRQEVAEEEEEEEEEESLSKEKMKNAFGFLGLPKPNISSGVHKLMRSIKSISQVFVFKEENEESDTDMEIGYPTDVKHVTHIGLDDSANTDPVKDWEDLKPPEILSFPSISLRQFELAMVAQAHQPLVVHPSRLA